MTDYFNKIENHKAIMLRFRDNIIRCCPICENHITYIDFITTDDKIDVRIDREIVEIESYINYFKKLWKDPRVAIPCCNCFELIKDIEKENDIEKKLFLISFSKSVLLSTIYEGKEIVLKNLKKFELIESL